MLNELDVVGKTTEKTHPIEDFDPHEEGSEPAPGVDELKLEVFILKDAVHGAHA